VTADKEAAGSFRGASSFVTLVPAGGCRDRGPDIGKSEHAEHAIAT
jgi:hypothetical protein